MTSSAPACPDCGQPAGTELAGDADGERWVCRNEACPEFGQPLRAAEPPAGDAASPDGGQRTI